MLNGFLNRRVTVWIAFSGFVINSGSVPEKIRGFLTGFDDEFIMIDNAIMISRKFLIKVQLS